MSNETLATLLSAREAQPFSEAEVQAILRSVLNQLVLLHQEGISPGPLSLERLSLQAGTVQLPPPQNDEPANPSQDIYALGLVALELLSGQVPSPRRQDPQWDWNEACFVSDQFNQLLERMLAPVESARFQDATAVLKAMETPRMVPLPQSPVPAPKQSPTAEPISATTPNSAAPSPPTKGMTGVFVALGAAAAVVLLGGLGVGVWLNPDLLSPVTSPLGRLRQNEQSGTAMFRGNLARTGVYPGSGPKALTRLIWKFRTEDLVDSSPAVADGVVYVGSFDNHLYAVDIATGQERWRFKTEALVGSSPAVADGVVYFGSGDGHLYAVE